MFIIVGKWTSYCMLLKLIIPIFILANPTNVYTYRDSVLCSCDILYVFLILFPNRQWGRGGVMPHQSTKFEALSTWSVLTADYFLLLQWLAA